MSADDGRRLVWFGEASLAGVAGRHSWVVGGGRLAGSLSERRSLPTSTSRSRLRACSRKTTCAISDTRQRVGLGAARRPQQVPACSSTRACRCWRGPSRTWTLRVSTGLGTFAPTPFTEETEEVGFSRLRFRDDLDVERAWAMSADVTRVIGAVRGHGHRVRLARQRSGDARGRVSVDRFALLNAFEPQWVWGAEAIARYRVEGFSLVGTYAWTRATELDLERGGRRETPLTPRHAVTFTAVRESETRGRIGVEGYYTGRQALDDDPYRQPRAAATCCSACSPSGGSAACGCSSTPRTSSTSGRPSTRRWFGPTVGPTAAGPWMPGRRLMASSSTAASASFFSKGPPDARRRGRTGGHEPAPPGARPAAR